MATPDAAERRRAIERQVQALTRRFAFSPNDAATWASATDAICAYLTGLWEQGGLAGATAADAFTVSCGLGATMTPQNIVDGDMIVAVKLQIVDSGDPIDLSFTQAMSAGS